jgi:hypothetical protein
MVANRLPKDLINSRIALSASRLNCQNTYILFFSNSDRVFHSDILTTIFVIQGYSK